MKYLSVIALLVLASLLGACGTIGVASTTVEPIEPAAAEFTPTTMRQNTILLVSLDNGSVIMQTISASADLCFKQNSDSLTKCFTQGEPVIDPATNAVIGFEMIENHIELIAKYD